MLKQKIIKRMKAGLALGSRPDFFIVGAQKGGTTSLYEYLVTSSKDIVPAISKELYYFTEFDVVEKRIYEANFPALKFKSITGEATPDYLFYHDCPRKISQYNPNAKIIMILRDPVERAFSQYAHQNYTWKTLASDPMSFSEAIREEENRFSVENLSKFYYEYKYYSYKARGLYYNQICNWLRFYPRDQLHIIFLSDLQSDPEKVVEQTLDFLGARIDKNNLRFPIKNKSPNSHIREEDRSYLREYFRSDSKKLFEFLNEPPRWEL